MTKIDGAGLEAELISHYSRYLCVLVSGYAEHSIKELVAQYCRKNANSEIQQYVSRQMRLVRNIDFEKLRQLVESFNVDWWRELAALRADELEAFGSVAAVRNSVSHGGDAGMTMGTVKQYFQQISTVLDDLCGYFDPS